VDVPLYIQEIIYTKLKAAYSPYLYTLRGTAGSNIDTAQSAYAALDKLVTWAKRKGAEVKIIKDDFATYADSARKSSLRITLEITDPVSQELDKLIQTFREKLHASPKDRIEWTRFRKDNSN